MCVRIRLPLSRMKHGLLQAALATSFTTVSRPQTRLAGVAEPTEPASGLVADVQLVAVFGSSLELPRRRHRYHKQTAKMGDTRNARHVDGDDHTGKAGTISERLTANSRHAARDGDTGQASATIEG